MTNTMQGSLYVTSSLVIPELDALIRHLHPQYALKNNNNDIQVFDRKMQLVRVAVHADLVKRFQQDLSTDKLEDFVVAMMLDPRFAQPTAAVKGLTDWDDGTLTEKGCVRMIRTAYESDYKEQAHSTVRTSSSPMVAPRSGGKAPLMFDSEDEDDMQEVAAGQEDELQLYLDAMKSMKKADRKNLKPLQWWEVNAHRFPSVARMAQNHLGCPASTGGLERMFSALGRNHDDFRKKTLETTLETRMMVKHNFHDV